MMSTQVVVEFVLPGESLVVAGYEAEDFVLFMLAADMTDHIAVPTESCITVRAMSSTSAWVDGVAIVLLVSDGSRLVSG